MAEAPSVQAGKRHFMMAEVATEVGNYEERPMFPADVDPQFHVSRNTDAQPFHLICEHDTVLVQVTGSARVHFHLGPVRYQDLESGDFLYVPAGTPHRIFPTTTSVHYRIKAQHAGREAVAWYCACGAELCYEQWDTDAEPLHAAYRRATDAFNDDPQHRTCDACGELADPVDTSSMAWAPPD